MIRKVIIIHDETMQFLELENSSVNIKSAQMEFYDLYMNVQVCLSALHNDITVIMHTLFLYVSEESSETSLQWLPCA